MRARFCLLLIFFSPFLFAQPLNRPKLIVGVVVDQMRYDYLFRYYEHYSKDGFKRLLNNGFNCKNTHYNYLPTYTGPGHASIYTGTTPSVHGIVGNAWYSKNENRTIYCAEDNGVNGVGTSGGEGKMSPKNMLSSTIGDELKLASKTSKVIGISLKDRGAVLPAGHTADAAYWYEGASGNWITSSFYMNDLPQWVKDFNNKKITHKYLSQKWTLLLEPSAYKHSLPDNNEFEEKFKGETEPVFDHDLPKILSSGGSLGLIRSTPFGNTFTLDFAMEAIKAEKLGEDENTDLIAISFSSPDYIGHQFGVSAREMQDNFLRLDRDIAQLLKFLDEKVGTSYLLFLTADHGAVEVPAYLQQKKIPAGYFYPPIDSLKKFLHNIYGDSLVLTWNNQQIFLQHEKIYSKGFKLHEVQKTVAAFMNGLTGVASAIPTLEISSNSHSEYFLKMMQNGYYYKRCGDVFVNLEPAWIEYSRTGTTHGSGYTYDTHVPLLWFGWNVKAGETVERIEITDIVPTICSMLNISFPNGCTGSPISSLFSK